MNDKQHISLGDKIILFDGVCNLCENAIQFIIKHERKPVFKFASLQSDIGKQLAEERGIDTAEVDSMILIDVGSAYYIKSTAALEISKELKGFYGLFSNFSFLPEGLRDKLYDYIAHNRYNWYGKKDACLIPTPELRSRFLD